MLDDSSVVLDTKMPSVLARGTCMIGRVDSYWRHIIWGRGWSFVSIFLRTGAKCSFHSKYRLYNSRTA